MSNRRLIGALALASLAVLTATGLRAVYAERGAFGPDDLTRYEERAYGVDLPDDLGHQPFWLTWTRGDGQAYITLAADPLAQSQVRELSVALYRYSRVGYAWAALGVVAGNLDLVPIGLFAVNIGSVAYLAWIAARNIEKWGPRSLALGLIPGVLISTMTDTAEAFGAALAAAGLVGGRLPALLAAAALGIVRPDFVTALFLRGRAGLSLAAATLGTAVGIRLFGAGLGLDYAGLNGNLTFPLVGYFDVWAGQPWEFRAITLGLVHASLVTILRGMRNEVGWVRIGPIATGVFVLMLSGMVLENPANSLRAAVALSLVWAIPPGQRRDGDIASDTLAA